MMDHAARGELSRMSVRETVIHPVSPGLAFLVITILCGTFPASTSAQRASDPEDGQWVMPGKNFENTRFSGLDQINTENAKNLTAKWQFSTGVLRGHECAPIVVGTTMYIITPFPNYVYALDLNLVLRGEDHFQHARRAHDRARCEHRQGAVAGKTG
jgi:glucose dehydrogenase